MLEPLEKRVEKLETELSVLKQDYKFMSALIGISISFIKSLHSIVDLSDLLTNRIISGWTNEVDKRDSVSDFLSSLRKKAEGDQSGTTPN